MSDADRATEPDRDDRIHSKRPGDAERQGKPRHRLVPRDRAALAARARADPLWLPLVAAVGLWYWVHQEIQYPTVAAYKNFLVNVMIPHWTLFGWMTLITETFIATTLILGLGTRLGSLVAIGMATNITIGILNVPHEWGWSYVMLIMFPVLFLLTDAGLGFGIDAF